MEPTGAAGEAISSIDPKWVAAIAGWLAALAGWSAFAIQHRQLRRLRAEDWSNWQKAFVAYRRDHFAPFAETINVAYQRFVDGQRGVPPTWARATHQARWPRNVPLPPGERLREWRSRYGTGLDREDDFLLQFCEAIYPPAKSGDPQRVRERSILTPEEFDIFDKARGGVADYFHQCGNLRVRSPEFSQFLEQVARANHYYRIKLVSYLEIACARAIGEFDETGRGKVGLFELGRDWSVDDMRK